MPNRILIPIVLFLLTIGSVHAQTACNVLADRLFADGFENATRTMKSLGWARGTDPARPLNDTGTVYCADEDSYGLECPVGTAPCQDAEYGRDLFAEAGMLDKIGAGDAGFDYTKLDAAGNDLPASASSWSCVRDNYTGLVWEVKRTDGSIYDATQEFSWYNPDGSENANNPGWEDGGFCSDTDLDTLDLVAQANADELCGRTDWRLPDMPDLDSLVHFGARMPTIETDYFPNTNIDFNSYWSNMTDISGGGNGSAWCTSFRGGASGTCVKTGGFCRLARVVAGPRATSPGIESNCARQNVVSTTPNNEFEIQPGGETVLHEPTGLIWKRCVEGLSWDGAECTGQDAGYDWQEALAAADAQSEWRVPNIRELLSLVEYCARLPAVNTDIFPMTGVDSVWTSTPVYNDSLQAWQVDFFDGRTDQAGKIDSGVPVLLVKDGP